MSQMNPIPNATFTYPDAMQQPRGSNVLGIVGFVVAILSLLCFCLPYVNVAAAGLALLLCVIALFKSPRGLAIAGTIIALVALIVGIIVTVTIASVAGRLGGIGNFVKGLGVASQIQQYQQTNAGKLPADLSSLPGLPPDWKLDSYGTPWMYEVAPDGASFSFKSAGPDKIANTSDDFDFSEMFKEMMQLPAQSGGAPSTPTTPSTPALDPAAPSETPTPSDQGQPPAPQQPAPPR